MLTVPLTLFSCRSVLTAQTIRATVVRLSRRPGITFLMLFVQKVFICNNSGIFCLFGPKSPNQWHVRLLRSRSDHQIHVDRY